MSTPGQPPYPPSDPQGGGLPPQAPPAQPYGQQSYGQPPQAPQYDPNAYGQAAPYGQPQYGQPAATGAPVLSIVAFVLSAIALLFVPILFGGAAIVCAVFAGRRHEKPAKVALIVSIVCTVLGIVIGFAVGAMMASQGL